MDLKEFKGVSDVREREFNRLGICSAEDLIKMFPRTYLDMTHCQRVAEAYHNDIILTSCEVVSVESNPYARKPVVKTLCRQEGGLFTAIWYNQPYVAGKLERGARYYMYGRVSNKYDLGAEMVNPVFEKAEDNRRLKGINPVYRLTGSLKQNTVRAVMKQALYNLEIRSAIPKALERKYNLIPLKDAYWKIHFPPTQNDIGIAAERIACEEYFVLLSAFKTIKGDRQDARLRAYSVTGEDVKGFISRFPFEFTAGQKEAVNDIFRNVRSPERMNRLIQGDVGSGKTAVALTAVYMAVKSGYQAAFLSPTEVLARQNADVVRRYFPDYRVEYLSGSAPAAEKRAIKKRVESGEVDILCGTHAIIQPDVRFSSLALCVCDEQQRFGVAQRSALSDKGDGCDCLVMSATPIPRTLSLIMYGDLDITTIRDKPASRQEISTSVIPPSKYDDMLRYIATEAMFGRRTYFVCPKIDEDEEGTVKSVTELYEELREKIPTVRLGLLHGRMKDAEKNEVMEAFRSGGYDALVTTTVIEVGVDVPEATIMVIYNAERFGLSQLHQLRGRVGRGKDKSYCFLLSGSDSDEAKARLSVIKNSTDGFEIAEADLQMRGGGDFMGTRQSGRLLSELKNLRFSVGAVFTAKAVSDEAFSGSYDIGPLKEAAMERYESLKDVVLN